MRWRWIVATVITPLVLNVPSPAQSVRLGYRFQPGEVLQYRVEHQLTITTTANDQDRTYRSESTSIRQLRVESVDANGAVITLIVPQIRVQATSPDGPQIVIDSEKDSNHPLARLAGKPLARFRVTPRGIVQDLQPLQEVQNWSNNVQLFFVPFPTAPVQTGETWTNEFDLPLPSAITSRGSVRLQQICRLVRTNGTEAVIQVKVQPVDAEQLDLRVRSLVGQFLIEGEAYFNMASGRIVRTSYRIADQYKTETYEVKVEGSLEEVLVLPTARK